MNVRNLIHECVYDNAYILNGMFKRRHSEIKELILMISDEKLKIDSEFMNHILSGTRCLLDSRKELKHLLVRPLFRTPDFLNKEKAFRIVENCVFDTINRIVKNDPPMTNNITVNGKIDFDKFLEQVSGKDLEDPNNTAYLIAMLNQMILDIIVGDGEVSKDIKSLMDKVFGSKDPVIITLDINVLVDKIKGYNVRPHANLLHLFENVVGLLHYAMSISTEKRKAERESRDKKSTTEES